MPVGSGEPREFLSLPKQQSPAEEEVEVRTTIQQIVLEHRRRYVSRRVTAELSQCGMIVTRRVSLARITRHPTERWMEQMARNAIDEESGHLHQLRYLLHDRDTKFCASCRAMLGTGNVKCLALPPRSPNLNALAERWVRSVKQECRSRLILFGEGSLQRALTEFLDHYHAERNHQGKGNVLLFPSRDTRQAGRGSAVQCRQRLGGLLNYYSRAA